MPVLYQDQDFQRIITWGFHASTSEAALACLWYSGFLDGKPFELRVWYTVVADENNHRSWDACKNEVLIGYWEG